MRHILLGIIWRKTAADSATSLLRSPCQDVETEECLSEINTTQHAIWRSVASENCVQSAAKIMVKNKKNFLIIWNFFFLQRYAFLLKDARNFGKMFEDE